MYLIKFIPLSIMLLTFTQSVFAQSQICSKVIPSTSPEKRFSDIGDGTVRDNETELMWARCSLGAFDSNCSSGDEVSLNWKQAVESASDFNLAGYTDWRLPNVKELFSILELSCRHPAINLNVFPSSSRQFWTSTPALITGAYRINFFDGTQSINERYKSYSIRLVRGGLIDGNDPTNDSGVSSQSGASSGGPVNAVGGEAGPGSGGTTTSVSSGVDSPNF